MNIKVKDAKFCVNIDWLQYSVVLKSATPELICPDGYRLEILAGNNIYKHRWILYNQGGTKVATALWCPYSSVLDKFVATVQVANIWLYDYYGIEYAHALVDEIWECSFNSVGRIDICCDFCASDRQLGIIRKLASNAMYVAKKGEGSIFWHNNKVGELHKVVRQPHCLSWGGKTSEIKCKLYWKSREVGLIGIEDDNGNKIVPEVDKQYIVDEWIRNGFDIKRVWRLEFSMKATGQMLFDGKCITFKELTDGMWFAKVFSRLYNTRFDIRKNQGHRTERHNRDEHVSLFHFEYDEIDMRWKDSNKDRIPDGEVLTTLRRMLKELISPAVIGNSVVFDAMCDVIRGIVRYNGMGSWCDKKLDGGLEGYLSAVADTVGTGIVEGDECMERLWM